MRAIRREATSSAEATRILHARVRANLVEQWRKIGVARGDECIKIHLYSVAVGQHLITGQGSVKRATR